MVQILDSPVRPRVVSPETGEAALVEDEVAEWLGKCDRGAFEIIGEAGAGKSTALSFLAATFRDRPSLRFLDEPSAGEALAAALQGRLIYTRQEPLQSGAVSRRLAPWTDDELLEYAMAVHRPACASIMARVREMPDRAQLCGAPQLWRAVLDELARDESQDDFREILVRKAAEALPPADPAIAMRYCLGKQLQWEVVASACHCELLHMPTWPELQRWLRHAVVQGWFAAQHYPAALERLDDLHFLHGPWPRHLLAETGRRLATRPKAMRHLEKIIEGRIKRFHRTAASLLHAADCGWRPAPCSQPRLAGAVLAGARWPGVDLSQVNLWRADLSHADLSRGMLKRVLGERAIFRGAKLAGAILDQARLQEADAAGADLSDARAIQSVWRRANFQRAKLRDADFCKADLAEADFSGADLTGARLIGAQLDGATLRRADLTRADLTNARLHKVRLAECELGGACLRGADLTEADLELLELADADLEGAVLIRADLTGSCLPRARLGRVVLRQAGLADVRWEGADLRGADFTDASFHLGSSRSGLVGSPLACEGSRTGFYTDDFDEQGFKSPEEIRKADLRGADLRRAKVDGADFYLVDLRGAIYDRLQAQHFVRCRAILFDSIRPK